MRNTLKTLLHWSQFLLLHAYLRIKFLLHTAIFKIHIISIGLLSKQIHACWEPRWLLSVSKQNCLFRVTKGRVLRYQFAWRHYKWPLTWRVLNLLVWIDVLRRLSWQIPPEWCDAPHDCRQSVQNKTTPILSRFERRNESAEIFRFGAQNYTRPVLSRHKPK